MVSIERLAELDKAATPGPWYAGDDMEFPGEGWHVWNSPMVPNKAIAHDIFHRPDAELIVALRNAAPELLAVVEAAREYVAIEDSDPAGFLPAFDRLRKALRALDATGGGDGAA